MREIAKEASALSGSAEVKDVKWPDARGSNFRITEFSGTSKVIDPSAGGTIKLSGTISNDSGNAANWTISIERKTYTGSGISPSVIWDAKDGNGKVLDPGNYSATLTARSTDGLSDTSTITFTVIPPDGESCGLYVDFGSSVNVASGALVHSQEAFSTKGGGLASGMTLYYNSADAHSGPLGTGWSHSYDISLNSNEDGSMVLHEEDGKRKLYTFSNGVYSSQPGDYAGLSKNSDGTFSLVQRDGTKYSFSPSGTISSIVDRNGNTTTLAYTGGNLSTVTDPFGRQATFAYDANNHLASVTDPAGSKYGFAYTGNALTSVTYPDGGNWYYSYDGNAYMLSKTDPVGNTTTYSYDSSHRVTSATDPEGKTRSVAYPQLGTDTTKTTTFTEKDSGVWTYRYDAVAGTLTSKADPENGITSYTYDSAGNHTSATLPDGTTSNYTYDAKGNMTSATDAAGQTTSYTHNDFGQVVSVKESDGNVTGYSYDANGNLTSMTDPTGTTTNYRVDARGKVTSVANAAGQTTTFSYDDDGNLASVTDPAGATTTYAYDPSGNVTSQTDNVGNVTRFAYDSRNRLVKVSDPQGNVTSYAYDQSGNKISQTDGNGHRTSFQYNYQGRPVRTTDSLGNVTAYAYGPTGCTTCGGGVDKLTSLTDANGNSTTYNYDSLGRVLSETDPLGNTTSYSYDSNGRLTSRTDANGATITYVYDSLGRLIRKSYPDGTASTFTYDSKGNVVTAANQNTSYSFVYNAKQKITSVTDSNGKTVSYSYDAAGNRTKMVSPDGRTIAYSYDSAGRLKSIIDIGTFSFGYDSLGRRSSLTYPNGDTTTYRYDSGGRVINIIHKNAKGIVIGSNSYTLDKVGNRLTNATQDGSISYQYDPIYRLTQAMSSTPGNSSNSTGKGGGISNATQQQKEFYIYDAVGNRLSSDRIPDYIYDGANQLMQDGGSYTYDKNGNLTAKVASDGKTAYTWDFENRLTKVTTPDGAAVTFEYDPFGRRIVKQVTDNGETTTTRYFYDDKNILFDYDDTGAIGNRYTHGPGIDEHFTVATGKDRYYYHTDGLASVMALTDSSGKVVQTYQYDSFGKLKDEMNRVKQPYTYTGREWDKETGLYYYRARYYDAMEGRFISKDPIGFAGGMNRYAYVDNRPIVYRDPRGTNPVAGVIEGGEIGFALGGPAGAVIGAVVGGVAGYYITDQFGNLFFKKGPKPYSKPKGCPTGTKPIDQVPGLDKDQIHGIKDGVGAGPRDWTGISPDGDVITGDRNGDAVNNGPYDSYLP